MKTSCQHCKAPIMARSHLSFLGDPLFAETYQCGAVQLWGAVEGDGVARTCPEKPETEERWLTADRLFVAPESPSAYAVSVSAEAARRSGKKNNSGGKP